MMTIRLLAAGLLLLIVGCTSPQVANMGQLALEAKIADAFISSGAAPDVVMSITLTQVEFDALDRALDTYFAFRDKWSGLQGDPGALAASLVSLRSDYAGLYAGYTEVMQITLNHWDEYSPAQQRQLEGLHAQAGSIHIKAGALFASGQRAQTIHTALEIGLVLAKAAAL